MNQNNIIEELREKFTIRSSDGIDWETVKQSSWSLENWLAIKTAEAKEAGAREERERLLERLEKFELPEGIKTQPEFGGFIVNKIVADLRKHVLSGCSEEVDELSADPTKWHGEWKQCAMRFYDLVLTGGSTEKFWNELLTV